MRFTVSCWAGSSVDGPLPVSTNAPHSPHVPEPPSDLTEVTRPGRVWMTESVLEAVTHRVRLIYEAAQTLPVSSC